VKKPLQKGGRPYTELDFHATVRTVPITSMLKINIAMMELITSMIKIIVEGHGNFPLQQGWGQSYLPPLGPRLFASLGGAGAKVIFHFVLSGEPT